MKKYILFFTALSSLSISALADEALDEKTQQSVKLNKSVVTATMKATLDELNRNVYEIDKESIQDKAYRSTEDIFRYMPFVGLSNVGLGSNLDLRGQGNRANTSVQVLINGVYANMLDSSHGVTPMNTLSPNTIESVEILPGGGAVMYGNGTRGGVVNITTQKRYEQPFFSAGLSYANIIASTGHNVNADAKFGAKVGDRTHLSLGAAYILRGGPREGDVTNGGEANFGLIYDIVAGGGHSINFDIDYFYGDIKTSPNNSFMDIPNPTKSDRKTAGNGDLHNTQQRLDVSLGYEGQLSENAKLDLKAFYHFNRINYVDSFTRLSSYLYNGMANLKNTSADQSGSLFDDQKIGLLAKYDLKHHNGRLILGLESIYNRGKRVMNQHIIWNGSVSIGQQNLTSYNHKMLIPTFGTKWTNSVFLIEKYDFTPRFSLTGGVRYENAQYDVDTTYDNNMTISNNTITYVTKGTLKDSVHNIALELTPNYRYSDYGNIYAKYERGYFSPSPNNLLQRQSRTYLPTDLKKETYDTFEVGLKDFWGDSVMFSAALFYTLTHNEFYTIGNAHSVSGVTYGNYDQTQRTGIELFSEQYLFGDMLRLSESFTYIDARVLKNNGKSSNAKIPYVSNYKATLSIHYQPMRKFGIWLQNSFIGKQKDVEGWVTTRNGQTTATTSTGQDTIPGYILTDLGVNYRAGDWSISAGVRNLFDTFYYSYYNGDASDPIAGYGFLIGQGRTAFAEVRYSF